MLEAPPKKRPPPKRASRKSLVQTEVSEPAAETARTHFPIVGIGASAGGLEAFRQLLQNLPADTGAAFVLVQHLDPKHESILPALLARATAMPVSEAQDGEKIEPDHVYVTPSQMDLAITEGRLKLLPRAVAPERHMPIDLFFRTLADIQAGKVIGVVLSGTASDGTLGSRRSRPPAVCAWRRTRSRPRSTACRATPSLRGASTPFCRPTALPWRSRG